MPPPWQRYQSWSIPELDPFIWDGEEEQIEEYALDEEPFQWDGEPQVASQADSTGSYNLFPHLWQGASGLPAKIDFARSLDQINTAQKFEPEFKIAQDMELQDTAYTAAGFPQNWLNMDEIEQQNWIFHNFPSGQLPAPMDEFLRRQMQATAVGDYIQEGEDPRLSTNQILAKNLTQAIINLNEHQRQGPAKDLEGLKAISEAKGWKENLSAIMSNPKAALQVSAESVGEFAPVIGAGIVTGIVFGPAAFAAMEVGGTAALTQIHGIQQALDHYGIDSSNPVEMLKLIENPQLLSEIKSKANKYMAIHTSLAPFGAAVIARVFNRIRNVSHARNTLRTGGVILTQGATEGLEELAALKGSGMWDPDSGPGEVILEMFAGTGMGTIYGLAPYLMNANQIRKSNKIDKTLKSFGLRAYRDENDDLVIDIDPEGPLGEATEREVVEPEPTIFDPEIAQPGESIFQEEQIEEEQTPSQVIEPGRVEEAPSVSALATNQELSNAKMDYLNRQKPQNESIRDFRVKNEPYLLRIDDNDNAYISVGDTQIPVTERNYLIGEDGKPLLDEQNNPQYNDSSRTDILALERRRSPEVEANYQALVDLLSKWHKVFGEDVGVRPINIVFESTLGKPDPSRYAGQIDFVNNELKLPIQQLLLSSTKDFRETIVHELLHAKFFSLFEAQVRREILSLGLSDNFNQSQITGEAARLYTDFAHRLVTPLEKEIKTFLRSHPDGKIGEVLNLPTNSQFYNSSPDEIFEGLVNNKTYFEDSGPSIIFPVIHELLAYQGQGDEFLTMPSESLTPEQRTFREKIIRIVKQLLDRLFTGQPEVQELTREDVIDFIRSMFYENAGLFEAGTAERTPFYQAGATEREKTDIRLQAEMEGVAPPPVSQAMDPSIDEEARLPELEEQLTTAKDRLKLLNRRIAPPGFEGEYSPEDFAQDISTTKDTIETLKEEIKETRKGLRQRDMG